jgi:hypothetical protein
MLLLLGVTVTSNVMEAADLYTITCFKSNCVDVTNVNVERGLEPELVVLGYTLDSYIILHTSKT